MLSIGKTLVLCGQTLYVIWWLMAIIAALNFGMLYGSQI